MDGISIDAQSRVLDDERRQQEVLEDAASGFMTLTRRAYFVIARFETIAPRSVSEGDM
jgi:hypothetical protein